jgi:hypothetical protein
MEVLKGPMMKVAVATGLLKEENGSMLQKKREVSDKKTLTIDY